MKVTAIKTEVFKEGESLFVFLLRHIKKIPEESVVVVTSKIVALSEGRTVVVKNKKEKEELIRAESEKCVETKFVWLTIKDGMVMPSAGVDESNADGKVILLPKDSFKTAEILRKQIQKKYNIKKVGVIITDSRTMPLRAGVTAVALGYAGIKGVRNYIGKKDIFGRKFVYSRTNVVDSLATAAVLVMGEGAEQQPLAIIKNAPVVFCEKVDRKEVLIDMEDDMYGPMLGGLKSPRV